MSILSVWRARCDRNAELRDERNDLIRAVNSAYRALTIDNYEAAYRHLDDAERHFGVLLRAASAARKRDDQH